jgi:hypothetical protein
MPNDPLRLARFAEAMAKRVEDEASKFLMTKKSREAGDDWKLEFGVWNFFERR